MRRIGIVVLASFCAACEPGESCSAEVPCEAGLTCVRSGDASFCLSVADGGAGAGGPAGGAGGAGGGRACGEGRGDAGCSESRPVEIAVPPYGLGSRVSAFVSPVDRSGEPPGAELSVRARFEGVALEPSLSTRDPWTWQIELDLGAAPRSNAGALVIEARLGEGPWARVDRLADNQPPAVTAVRQLEEVPARRDRKVVFAVDMDEEVETVQAQLLGPGDLPGDGSRVRYRDGLPRFEIDSRDPMTSFPAFEGELDVYVTARDLAGNEASAVAGRVRLTRLAWTQEVVAHAPLSSPVIVVGAIWVGVGSLAFEGNLARVAEDGVELHQVGRRPYPVIAASDAGLVLPSSGEIWIAAPDRLHEAHACAVLPMAGHGNELPAVGRGAGGERIAVVARSVLALIDPLSCASQIVDRDDEGATPTLDPVFASTGAGLRALTGVEGGVAHFDELRGGGVAASGRRSWDGFGGAYPLASDGERVVAAAGNEVFLADLGTGSLARATLPAVAAGPAVIGQEHVIVPTVNGLAVLPIEGFEGARAAQIGSGPVQTSPVIGKGGLVYAAALDGTIQAARLGAAGPSLEWSAQLGAFPVAPTLTCDGLLIVPDASGTVRAIVTDSAGLDPDAPWPKYRHDLHNSGNADTAIGCP